MQSLFSLRVITIISGHNAKATIGRHALQQGTELFNEICGCVYVHVTVLVKIIV